MNINNFINDKLLDFFAFNQDGYVFYFFIAGVYLLIMFLAFGIYAFVDSRKRGVNTVIALIIGIVVLIFNIPALILYLILRPSKTKAENEWEELERKFLSHEVDDFISCDACNTILSADDLYCLNCGKQHRAKCSCGKLIESNWAYCPQCGKSSIYYKKVKRDVRAEQLELEENVPNKKSDKNEMGLLAGLLIFTKSLIQKSSDALSKMGSKFKNFLSETDAKDSESSTVEITTNLNPYKSETKIVNPTNKRPIKKKKSKKKRRR